MAAEKVTTMVLQVDLQCPCCYKKVKKILCKIPQVRDQVFDEKANKVIIVVVCCSPEKIQNKICSKGGGVIKSVEIVQPTMPADPVEKKKPADPVEKKKEADKPKEAEKKKEADKPKEAEKKKEADKPKEAEKKKEADKPKEAEKPKDAPKPDQQKPPAGPAPSPKPEPVYATHPVQGYPPVYPIGICYGPYYDVYGAGPGHVVPPQQPNYGYDYGAPQPCYDYGRPPCHCGCGGRRGCDYYSEENASACSVM